ncbi:MAG: J domain-containing protein [Rhodospirillales bacterium]|nr:J domain-containing protein [Rhodospirillales bacterium]
MHKGTQQAVLREPFDSDRSGHRVCTHPGCNERADYRAPVSRDRPNVYYWFCLEHVRAYNARWDYFKGMSSAQIEAHLRADQTWQRPSWPLGSGFQVQDPLGLLGKEAPAGPPRKPPSRETAALATLDLRPDCPFAEIKARYKSLAKQLHPDANGGDRQAEERLKDVNRAYGTLKAAYSRPA